MGAVLAALLNDPWRWRPHPEVWFLLASLAVLYAYAVRVVGPKAVPAGTPVVTRRQIGFFVAAMALLWVSSDWPVHDVGEDYLYSVHMAQHLTFTMVVAPLLLLATPRWLAELVLGGGRVRSVVRWLSRPLPAIAVWNVMLAVTHWPALVNRSVESAPLHYGVHTYVVLSALVMWMPVCGPFKEWRLSLPTQMAYLFLNSIVPTVPSAWLVVSEHPVFTVYDRPFRMWGLSIQEDQQIAGVMMKIGAGMYMWVIITVKFFQWASRHEAAQRLGRNVSERDVLTWEDVQAAFETEPAPREATRRS